MKSVNVILRPLTVMEGFQAEQQHDLLCLEGFLQLLCGEGIMDTRHKSLAGSDAGNVVRGGGSFGSEKQQLGWGAEVSGEGGRG